MQHTYCLFMQLRAAYLSMHRQTNAYLSGPGITADQFVCLLILNEEKGIIQKELVQRATSDPNTIRAMLILLEKQHLIIRKPDPQDNRARIVTITEKGRRVVNQAVIRLKPVRKHLE
jgi:DNA-binding MarR family transcriptional regulator